MEFLNVGHKIAAGILPICTSTGRILLGRRSFDSNPPNTWALFGGTFEEEDLTPQKTAIREFGEETKYCGGYSISNKPLHILKDNFVRYYTYVGLFDKEFIPYVNGEDKDSQEHLDYGWFDLYCLPDNMLFDLIKVFDEKWDTIECIIKRNNIY